MIIEMVSLETGWQAPPWSVEEALKVMDGWQIKTSVLSITSPGPAIAGTGEVARKLTRQINEETAAIVKANPGRFKFFASVPSFVDSEGAVAEIEYSLKTLGAAGVVVMTSYSDK
jgi:predicted TIM-barrel fold metal-dependent hydrolase